jgi:hypothetical protein
LPLAPLYYPPKEATMPFRVTDRDGQTYAFDDSQREFVKLLIQQNTDLGCRVLELETQNDILEMRLRKSAQTTDEIVTASIRSLDPEG